MHKLSFIKTIFISQMCLSEAAFTLRSDLLYGELVSEALHLHPSLLLLVWVIQEEPGVSVQRVGLLMLVTMVQLGRDICGGDKLPSLRVEELEDFCEVVDHQP